MIINDKKISNFLDTILLLKEHLLMNTSRYNKNTCFYNM